MPIVYVKQRLLHLKVHLHAQAMSADHQVQKSATTGASGACRLHGSADMLPHTAPPSQASPAAPHIIHQSGVALVTNCLERVSDCLQLCRCIPGEHLGVAAQGLQVLEPGERCSGRRAEEDKGRTRVRLALVSSHAAREQP